MWAQRLIAPRRFAAVEVPAPTAAGLRPGEVLLRVAAGGICGSDLPFFSGSGASEVTGHLAAFGDPGFPLHEVAGRVLASRHRAIGVGERVAGWASRFDGLAELTVADGDGLHRTGLPPRAAVVLQPLACVLHAVERIRPLAGLTVAVVGQGPIGLLFSHVAGSAGARRVIGVDRVDRTGAAASFGVGEMVHASSDRWARTLADDDRPDVVIEAIGHRTATLDHAVQAVAPGGEIFYFGIADDPSYPFALRAFQRKNLTLRSGVTMERRRMLAAAGAYLDDHPELLDGYVTHVLAATEAQQAFDLALAPAPGQVKIVLTMS
jgi:L-iditol 2-dehydrogenase